MATKTKKKKASAARLRTDAIPRAAVARVVQDRITELGLTRETSARIVKDAPSQMSRLMTGHITDFSVDRLVRAARRLGSDVQVTFVHPRPRTAAGNGRRTGDCHVYVQYGTRGRARRVRA